jgi:hypothetical protein
MGRTDEKRRHTEGRENMEEMFDPHKWKRLQNNDAGVMLDG